MPEPRMDLWIQRLSVLAMVSLVLTLVGVGVVLYGPGTAHAETTRSQVSR